MPDVESIVLKLLDMMVETTRALATSQAQIISMQDQYKEHQAEEMRYHAEIKASIEIITARQMVSNDILQQAKGGWKTLVTVGTISSAVTTALAWVWVHFGGRPPPPLQ